LSYPYSFASAERRKSSPANRPLRRVSPSRLVGAARRRHRGRRLAVVDTHFPWQISGFRYQEGLEIRERRPDTLFFSWHALTDPFPANVYPLAAFPRLAARSGVTDVYLVFLNVAIAFLGLHEHPGAAEVAGIPSFSQGKVVDSLGLRVHVQLYPGGGLLPTTPPAILRAVSDRCATVFSNVGEVEQAVPGTEFVPMLVGAGAYPYRPRGPAERLRLVFVGDDRPRKGLRTLVDAFNTLPEGFSLDLVGPHDAELARLKNPHFRAHGWLEPAELLELYKRTDVFVSPSTVETEDELAIGMIDGFPTTAAAEAMASGCVLVSSNPRKEFRALRPGHDYVDVPDRDPHALAETLMKLNGDRGHLARMAVRGAARVREFSTEVVVTRKLAAMGLWESEPELAGGKGISGGSDTAAPGSRLPVETRRRMESLLATIPTDVGGGSSLTKALVVGDQIVRYAVKSLVEVGVYRGRFLLPAALLLRDLGRGPAIGIDPYSPVAAVQKDLASLQPGIVGAVERWASTLDWDALYEEVTKTIASFGLNGVCLIDRRRAEEAANDLADGTVDLVHIDGNHDRLQVEHDLDSFLPKLRSRGLVVIDDLSWPSVATAVQAREPDLDLVYRLQKSRADDFGVFRLRG
jgi:glycosyltransferase involved in cell wall biosynthesis